MLSVLWSQLTWRDLFAVGSFLFNIVAVIAYLEQRRASRQTADIAEWARRNLDKSISEEDLRKLSDQKADMQQEISRRIPALARNAVLQEQAQLHERAIAGHITAWQSVKRELGSESTPSFVSPELQQAIFDRIVPQYMRQERRDRLRTRLAVLSVGLAASPSLFPSPLSGAFALLLGMPLLYTAVRLFVLNEGFDHAFRILRPWCLGAYLVVALAVGAIGGFEILYLPTRSGSRYIGIGCVIIAGILLAIYVLRRKWLDRVVQGLCGHDIGVTIESTEVGRIP